MLDHARWQAFCIVTQVDPATKVEAVGGIELAPQGSCDCKAPVLAPDAHVFILVSVSCVTRRDATVV